MQLIPEFEIGLINAWILIAIFLILFILPQFFKDIGKKIVHSEKEKKLSRFIAPIAVILWIYSIFLPLKTGTAWLYAGISIYVLGMIIGIIAIVSIATTPAGKPFTKGMYRYSRHPLSASMFLVLLGIGVATASWLYLLLLAILMVVNHYLINIEELSCIEKFGDTYRKYMKRTPRWIGIPKS